MLRRKITAIALLLSFVAMASSGVLMMIVDRPSFSIRMHPVHKLFGIVMVLAALSHLGLNARAALAYLKERSVLLVAAVLVVALVGSYGVVLLRPLPAGPAEQLDKAAAELEP